MAEGGKSEEKGCLGSIMDAISSFFMFIFEAVMFVFNKFYQLLVMILGCFEFFWYPIKERVRGCCRWCERSKNRSNDPSLSTFDNEV